MRRVLFRPQAIADIDGIWDYTADRWGVAQADRYILAVRATCEAITRDEVPGRDASAVCPGYRKVPSGRHVIFFRLTPDDAVDVVRVLHERMDVDTQFGPQVPEDE
jgi:toxin ParE1/3/4